MTEIRESRAFVQELKFVVSPSQADAVRQWARVHMSPDPHAGGAAGDQYRVTSLYLDTDDMAVFERRGSYARSKYRVRRYGDGERIFLERKLKTRNRVGKLRSVLDRAELPMLERADATRRWAGHWFHQRVRVRGLRPVCQISYWRTARMGVSENGPIRLTVDDGVCALPASTFAFADPEEGMLLCPDQRILELKYRLEIPGLFKQLMQEFDLRPQASSKYRLAVTGLGLKLESVCPNS
ncbi:MAG: polyphosphate polymerase domain-containing protein [Acidobacteria bacterium]|nr:polyphosphate polymerase domain-containing protein [Acidobacteriota bacterium]